MRKLLASDVDGTLYVNQEIHDKSIEYIKRFRDDGHIFLLCTGRNFGGVKQVINNYDIEVDGFVLCNGAVLLDKDFNVIYSESIQDSVIKKVFLECKNDENFNFYFSDNDRLYIVDGYNTNPMISAADIKDMEIVTIDEKDFYNNEYFANVIGVEIKDKSIEKSASILVKLQTMLGKEVSIYRNQNFIDIVPKDCSKSEGIAKVLERYGVEEDNVFVIGDSWNDLSMFEKYKNSYTFSYAEEDLQKQAANIVDAFYDCLEGIFEK